jgi:hypothetical protein
MITRSLPECKYLRTPNSGHVADDGESLESRRKDTAAIYDPCKHILVPGPGAREAAVSHRSHGLAFSDELWKAFVNSYLPTRSKPSNLHRPFGGSSLPSSRDGSTPNTDSGFLTNMLMGN